eukprot:752299-Hanusia_phi.AAC.3
MGGRGFGRSVGKSREGRGGSQSKTDRSRSSQRERHVGRQRSRKNVQAAGESFSAVFVLLTHLTARSQAASDGRSGSGAYAPWDVGIHTRALPSWSTWMVVEDDECRNISSCNGAVAIRMQIWYILTGMHHARLLIGCLLVQGKKMDISVQQQHNKV